MTRVLYGFSGEGSGHSSRAREMMRGLQERGHQVVGASYDRGYANLRGEFELVEIEGLSIASVDNQVSVVRTFAENAAKLSDGIAGLRRLRQARRELLPEVVITDFEPLTAYLAQHDGLPLVTLDNQHRMRYLRYPVPPGLRKDALVAEAVIRALVPRPDVSLVTTFWFGEATNDRTFLFPPILRREVLAATPRDDGHVLVYFTKGFDAFLERLCACPRERFVVYGTGREGSDGNLEHRAPSRDGFLDALAGAKAVIATAGFTLLTEALHLGKPVLALPMAGQFEQELNAHLLADAGYGRNGRGGGADLVGDFLYRLPEYRARLADYPRADNGAIAAKLEELVADGGAAARRFHARRARG
jgi:uncharacterized protein (TIGR00661 family)